MLKEKLKFIRLDYIYKHVELLRIDSPALGWDGLVETNELSGLGSLIRHCKAHKPKYRHPL